MTSLRLPSSMPSGAIDARLLVLGPALGTPSTMWDEAAGLLRDDFRVLTLEHFGHNGAPAAPRSFTMQDLADAVVGILDELGEEKSYFAGVSISGAIGLELARRHPERVPAVAVMCCAAGQGQPDRLAAMAAQVRAEGTAERSGGVGERWFAPDAATRNAPLIDGIERTIRTADDETYARYLEALGHHDVGNALEDVDVPVLAVWGEYDRMVPESALARIAEGVARGSLTGVKNAGHLPPAEQPGTVAALLREFFQAS
ncbi:alpha/beta fold hydrolase [Arthrobacter sp. KNU-44]|uniref:alpha/beta fold hydrolase n=1 Tax=Arthrobacter sp. KNU-44 TaxID=3450744 RepID=UPI003F43A856